MREDLHDGTVDGIVEAFPWDKNAKEEKFNLIRLDQFQSSRCGTMGGKPLSESYANERHVDAYIGAFLKLAAPLVAVLDGNAEQAYNLILTRRNSFKERNRMAGAEILNKLVPHFVAIKKAIEGKYVIKIDTYEPRDLWLGQIVAEGGGGFCSHTVRTACPPDPNVVWLDILIHLVPEKGKLIFGGGDGYHRNYAHGEEVDREPSIPLDDLSGLCDAIAKAMKDTETNTEIEEDGVS